jgi:hypothetical protein
MAEPVLKGQRILGSNRPPKSTSAIRICEQGGCETKLSRYNRRDHCFAHAPTKFPRLRGRIVADG